MSHTEIVVVAIGGRSTYYEDLLADPIGFVERQRANLQRVAAERLHGQQLLPLRRNDEWRVILPDRDPLGVIEDLHAIGERYGAEPAVLLGSAIRDNPGAVVIWQPVEVVPKGHDGAVQRVPNHYRGGLTA